MSQNVQNIRLRRPQSTPAKPALARHTGILQDQLRRSARRPWSPSLSMAIRMLLLVRVSAAMYSNIDDCDEVFNFWEPLHFLDRGYGFQTWETSPAYAIRSWAYILLHLPIARFMRVVVPGADKRPAFFAVRILLGVLSSFAEATFYKTVHERINERVGRYLFFMLLFSAGMWNAASAFLPSSFAMYASTFAFSYAFVPSSLANHRRVLLSTLLFAISAIVGWPFSLALAIPFVFEELFIASADRVTSETRVTWLKNRWQRLFTAGILASSVFVPVTIIDSLAYGKLTLVPWNIVKYNVFGGSSRGPDLYGTESWYFYVLNLVLNFNVLAPLAFISLPALAVTYVVDRKRLGFRNPSSDQSSPFTVLALRMVPFYLWLGILSLQPHKEERFMFPAYPLLCFNAAVALYLVRGWQEVFFVSVTKSSYRAAQSGLFRSFTLSVVTAASIISISRILALGKYYHTPLSVIYQFQSKEIPRLLNDSGLLPPPIPNISPEDQPRIDLTPVREFDIRLCTGKEWYRFPGHYLVPDGVHVHFVESDFDGLLPGQFVEAGHGRAHNATRRGGLDLWPWPETRLVPVDQNDLNKAEPAHYIPVKECDYLLDLDFPLHPTTSAKEPRYVIDSATWDRVTCQPFLDASHSSLLTRILWMPGKNWQAFNQYGDYCLLRNRKRVERKVEEIKRRK